MRSSTVSSLLSSGTAGPLRLVDRAAHLVRSDARALYAAVLPASGGLALLGLSLYYVERVLAITSLRLGFAIAAVALLGWRALAAAATAGHIAALADGVPSRLEDVHIALRPRRARIVLVALLNGLLDVPMIALAAWMSQMGPLGAAFLVPLAGLRWVGASPTWLARVAVTGEGVGRAWLGAWRDTNGGRGKAYVVETLLALVALLVFFNGLTALVLGAGIGGSLLGLDLAFAASFLSPSNGFALTALLVVTLVVVEPLRMVASALLWVDARVRHDALDLRRRLDALDDAPGAASSPQRPRGAGPAIAAALLLVSGMAWSRNASGQSFEEERDHARAHAGPVTSETMPAFVYPYDPIAVVPLPEVPASEGVEARRRAVQILGAREFAPVPEPGAGHVGEWLREVVRDVIDLLMPDTDLLPRVGLELGLPGMRTFLVIGAVVLLCALAFTAWVLHSSRQRGASDASEPGDPIADVRERDPIDILAEASEQRRRGEMRAALRSAYLATLVQLDRQRAIVFDPARTNWQYLRDLAAGERRDLFASLTRLFDHKWYGHEPVSDDDVAAADGLARAILAWTQGTEDVASTA